MFLITEHPKSFTYNHHVGGPPGQQPLMPATISSRRDSLLQKYLGKPTVKKKGKQKWKILPLKPQEVLKTQSNPGPVAISPDNQFIVFSSGRQSATIPCKACDWKDIKGGKKQSEENM